MTTKIQTIPASDLSSEQIACWARLQESNSLFESPYFRPEYTCAVAAVRDDVEVAVFEQNNQPVGFWPFQRYRSQIAIPVSGRLSDFHGVIIDSNIDWNAKNLLQACGLKTWNFDHLLTAQAEFQEYHFQSNDSIYLDLSNGFDAYCKARRQAGTKKIKQTLRKGRQLARDVGEVRFEEHSVDPQLFEKLLEWKSAQYRRSNLIDLFQFDWTRQLLQEALNKTDDAFRGMLSVLFVNDRVAAIDFGLRSHTVLHSWFPAYDLSLRNYSPGHLLLLKVAESCEKLGIHRIHLGKGEESYKTSFASGSINVAEGCVESSRIKQMAKASWHQAQEIAKRSPLRQVFRRPVRLVRQFFDQISTY